MSDVALSCLVTRGLLGQDDLEINDFENYYLTPDLLGGQVTWNKQKVGSNYLDGEVTVSMVRGLVQEKLSIEVLADTAQEMAENLAEVIEAFSQLSYRLQFTINGDLQLVYQCEPLNFTIPWSGPRIVAGQMQIQFNFERQPQPLQGIF